jgi:TRAP transporter TAXI family solute receptor
MLLTRGFVDRAMRKAILIFLAVMLVGLGAGTAALHFYNRPVVLRVAVPQLVEDIRVVTAAGHLFAHQHKKIRLQTTQVPDSAAAAGAVESGAADLAVMRSDIALTSNAQSLAILHRNPILLTAPGGSKLRKIQDLRGKRIGIVHEIATMEPNARLVETILSQYDIPRQAVTLVSLTPTEVGTALSAGKVDVIFSATAPSSGYENDVVAAVAALSKKPPIFIPIDEAKAISKRLPALEPMEIVPGSFGGDPPRPASAFETLSVSVLLMARPTLRDDIAAEVTRLFFSHRGGIALSAPLANSIEAPSTDRGTAIPVHQGAVDYLDGTERNFFEKYSDGFYIGAMLLSLLGSGAAALASRLNVAPLRRAERLTEELLTNLQAAREKTTQAELDALEREVDAAVTKMLADPKLRNLDAPGVHLVTLALDQTRRAIEERRQLVAREDKVVEFPAPRSVPPAAG